MMKKFFETFLNKSGKEKITIVILIGVLLLVIMIPTEKKEVKKDSGQTDDSKTVSDSQGEAFLYEVYIEKKLETALSKVEGVGAVEAVVVLKTSGEKILAKDNEFTSSSLSETDNQNNTKLQNTESGSNTHIFVENGNGSQPYITSQNMPEIEGVLVVAAGGGDGTIAAQITAAVEALLGIPAHKIKVLKMS